jgi:hypothetical protein
MIRLPGHCFYRTLRDKLGWGVLPPTPKSHIDDDDPPRDLTAS